MKERVLKAKGHPFNHYLQVDQRADLAYRECVCVSLSLHIFGNQWLHLQILAKIRAVVVAKLIERTLPIPEVSGSNPVIGKNIYRTFVYSHLC